MFIKEMKLYFAYLMECLGEAGDSPDHRIKSYIETFSSNLMDGVAYYRRLADGLTKEWSCVRDKLNEGLVEAERQLEQLMEQVRSFTSGSRIVPSPKIS